MSVKVVAIVALAIAGTLAAYHFHHHGEHKAHAHANSTFVAQNSNESHYVPNKVLMFASYKKQLGLKFGAAENNQRFEVFCNNLNVINAHNSKESSYKLGITSLTHLTFEEFSALKLGYNARPANKTVKATTKTVKTTNKTALHDGDQVDWVSAGAVTEVKNQGQCGACWSFSTTGALEGLNFITNGVLVSLSEQQLIDCSGSYGNQGCNGGLMDDAFQYVADNGITTEANYPYTAADGTCQSSNFQSAFQNGGYQDVTQNDNDALLQAIKGQPVSVAIEADTQTFQLYNSGVITGDACGTQLDHGVLAVGYGSQGGQNYIKVKNSWGSDWGLNGYVLIGQADGAGVCGINSDPSYPTA